MESNKHLDGKTWIKYSISVWNDIEKSSEEKKIAKKHPAIFPISLASRILDCFTMSLTDTPITVLDPFLGSGSTLLAAREKGYSGVGFDVVNDFIKLASDRFNKELFEEKAEFEIIKEHKLLDIKENAFYLVQDDARKIKEYLKSESISIMITSPPYWLVHKRKRSADYKNERPYSDLDIDLGNIQSYEDFLNQIKIVFEGSYGALKKNCYSIVNVMDLRYGSKFIPYHSDIARIMQDIGFSFEDIIIWNRAKEYNNIKPLGYPYKFIINKVHEYLLVFRKV
jgi:DNA modification methylase